MDATRIREHARPRIWVAMRAVHGCRTQLAGTSGSRAWHTSLFSLSGCRRLTRHTPSASVNPNPDEIRSELSRLSLPSVRKARSSWIETSKARPKGLRLRLATVLLATLVVGGELQTTIHSFKIGVVLRINGSKSTVFGGYEDRRSDDGIRGPMSERLALHNAAVRVLCPSNPEPSNAVGLDAASRRNIDIDVIFLSVSGCMHGLRRMGSRGLHGATATEGRK